MAEEEKKEEQTEEQKEESPPQKSAADALEDGGGGGKGKLIIRLAILVVLAVAGGIGGHLFSRMGGAPAESEAAALANGEQGDSEQADGEQTEEPEYKRPSKRESPEDIVGEYYPIPTILANLRDPRLRRHVSADLVLVIRKDDFRDASTLIETRMPDLRNIVIHYIADLKVEDMRGASSLNRICRELQDSFNDRLWPKQRPQIVRVQYDKWIVQ